MARRALTILALGFMVLALAPLQAYACCEVETPPEEEVCPEDPKEELQCEPYTTTYEKSNRWEKGHLWGINFYVCVDTYEPINETIPADQECEYKLACHDCNFIKRIVGCFDPATKILMGDKTEKLVSLLKEGDYVWNPITNRSMKVTKRYAGPEELAMVEVGFGKRTLKVTQDHPMIVENPAARVSLLEGAELSTGRNLVKQASELTMDDKVLGSDGSYHSVTVLRKLPVNPDQVVINFEVDSDSLELGDHAVVANGVVTGDHSIQKALKKSQSF